MSKRPKSSLRFNQRGGVIANERYMFKSQSWLSLSPQAKVLLCLLQTHWNPNEPVGYGIREAMDKIPCAKGTAQRAFREAQEAGFIVMVDESLFNSRAQSKSRTWRLTWLPLAGKEPTNEWENRATGANLHLVSNAQGQIRTQPDQRECA